MSCGFECTADGRKIVACQRCIRREREVGNVVAVGSVLASQMKLTLEIDLSHGDVAQGHADIFMTEQVHERGKRDAQAHHFGGEGVPELMWDNMLRATRATGYVG